MRILENMIGRRANFLRFVRRIFPHLRVAIGPVGTSMGFRCQLRGRPLIVHLFPADSVGNWQTGPSVKHGVVEVGGATVPGPTISAGAGTIPHDGNKFFGDPALGQQSTVTFSITNPSNMPLMALVTSLTTPGNRSVTLKVTNTPSSCPFNIYLHNDYAEVTPPVA